MIFRFSKFEGAGNDFLLFDDRSLQFPLESVSSLCDRRRGVGADGILLLQPNFRMRIFNADGSEADMCGNGLRCFVRYLERLGELQKSCDIMTNSGVHPCRIQDGIVTTTLRKATVLKRNIISNGFSLDLIDTGVPHAVCLVPDVACIDVSYVGKAIRSDPVWGSQGANATFASFRDEQLYVRTYERGVEEETLACGTGVVAAAIAVSDQLSVIFPLKVRTQSGDLLIVGFSERNDLLELTGPANHVFDGTIFIKEMSSC